jgi:hypothetical protein
MWGQRLECRDFLEQLHDQDEHIEVEGDYGADHVRLPPTADQVTAITSFNRQRQQYQGEDPDDDPGSNSFEGKKKPVTLVNTVVTTKSRVQPSSLLPRIIP